MSTPKQTEEVRKQLDELLKAAHDRPLNSQELLIINDNAIGFDAVLGLRYTHISRGEVRAMVRVNPTLLQPWGLATAGVLIPIADTVGALAAAVLASDVVVGVKTSTDFLTSVTRGTIVARATPLQAGRRSQIWNIELQHGGNLVALSSVRTITLSSSAYS